MPSGQRLRNGGTHRCSSLQQLSLFVLFLSICVFIVYCTFVYLHYCTLQLSGHIGHRFPNEHDHLLRLSSHTQHSGQDSETSGISVDCCRIEQVMQTAKREEAKARLQSWTTGYGSSHSDLRCRASALQTPDPWHTRRMIWTYSWLEITMFGTAVCLSSQRPGYVLKSRMPRCS